MIENMNNINSNNILFKPAKYINGGPALLQFGPYFITNKNVCNFNLIL